MPIQLGLQSIKNTLLRCHKSMPYKLVHCYLLLHYDESSNDTFCFGFSSFLTPLLKTVLNPCYGDGTVCACDESVCVLCVCLG